LSIQQSVTVKENEAPPEIYPCFDECNFEDVQSQKVDKVAGLFEGLSVSDHSTPIVLCEDSQSEKDDTPVKAPKEKRISSSSDHSFTCRRLVNISLNEKRKQKKLSRSYRESLLIDTSTSLSISKSLQSKSNISFKDSLCKSLTATDSENKILNLCGQEEVLPIEFVIGKQIEKKIGEGSYGEVYLRDDGVQLTALKIVPVGRISTEQMKIDDVIPEMAISRKLSSWKQLSQEKQLYPDNCVEGFIELKRLSFCKGKFPQHLKLLWDDWKENEENDCQNEHPDVYTDDQKYVVFENRFGGQDLEKCKISTMKEALSILKQLVSTLASAERSIQFEHRDLHWGNILIDRVKDKKKSLFVLVEGSEYEIASCGLIVTIIDFTLARMLSEGCVVYTDLSEEDVLFKGEGDPQFDVYRKMKETNRNDWEAFNPITNVLWIHYVTNKLISKIRQQATLKRFAARVLKYSSCYDILMKDELFG